MPPHLPLNGSGKRMETIKKRLLMQTPEDFSLDGWLKGFEPSTLGTTNQCSNQLSYNHRKGCKNKEKM